MPISKAMLAREFLMLMQSKRRQATSLPLVVGSAATRSFMDESAASVAILVIDALNQRLLPGVVAKETAAARRRPLMPGDNRFEATAISQTALFHRTERAPSGLIVYGAPDHLNRA